MFWKSWNRRETFPERRLACIRREMGLIGADMEALSRTVRSGGQVPAPRGLLSEDWRRRQEAEEQLAMLPEWFPRPAGDDDISARSERGFVRNEKFVDYLASNFQPSQKGKAEEPDEHSDRRWVFVGVAIAIVILYILAVMHWR